jgi:hypothetical protein
MAELLHIDPRDLAPGDGFAAAFDWARFGLHLIESTEHPWFERAYRRMWDEFSNHDSMERREIIESRLGWDPARPSDDGWRILYRIIVVSDGDRLAAVRDASAIARDGSNQVVVHLSHVLVEPEYRGGALAAWMRAFPVQMARRCAGDANAGITLVAEMEHPSPGDPMSIKRLASYERAGFLKVDPAGVDYHQPDFREPAAIDASGGPKPLPYLLIVRRVGRESQTSITGRTARGIVSALYATYARHFREQDMAGVWQMLERYPPDDQPIRLLPPTR